MTPLTRAQAIVVSGYTGILACPFGWFHADIETRLGRSILSHQLADAVFARGIADLYRADFLALRPEEG